MPRGDKSAYTDKKNRQAEHSEESYEERGVSQGEVERRAGATVNKQTGGGKRSGSGRNTKDKAKKARVVVDHSRFLDEANSVDTRSLSRNKTRGGEAPPAREDRTAQAPGPKNNLFLEIHSDPRSRHRSVHQPL